MNQLISITESKVLEDFQKELGEIHKELSPELQEKLLAAFNKFWEAVKFTKTDGLTKKL